MYTNKERKNSKEYKFIDIIQKRRGLKQSYNLMDNRLGCIEKHVIQGYFDTSGYQNAAQIWKQAFENVKNLDKRLNLRVSRRDSYIDDLKENLENKARKAETVIAGEAFETNQWKQPKGRSIVIGPGGTSGADLFTYESLKYGERAQTPTEYGEVKSASKPATFLDGIANAYNDRGQEYIIMYTTDQNIPPDKTEFRRNGINYAITHKKYPEGLFGEKTYTFVATIELPDQNATCYLYTWI